MVVTAAVVLSVDGKLTRHQETGTHDWASAEDQQQFQALIAAHEVMLMGSHTYEAGRAAMRLELPIKRIVLTHHPEKFHGQAVTNRLEFRSEASADLVEDLRAAGVRTVLIVGGPQIMTELLRHGLINYLIVTLEPCLFGTGIPLLELIAIDTKLELVDHRQLNAQGSLCLRYKVISSS